MGKHNSSSRFSPSIYSRFGFIFLQIKQFEEENSRKYKRVLEDKDTHQQLRDDTLLYIQYYRVLQVGLAYSSFHEYHYPIPLPLPFRDEPFPSLDLVGAAQNTIEAASTREAIERVERLVERRERLKFLDICHECVGLHEDDYYARRRRNRQVYESVKSSGRPRSIENAELVRAFYTDEDYADDEERELLEKRGRRAPEPAGESSERSAGHGQQQ